MRIRGRRNEAVPAMDVIEMIMTSSSGILKFAKCRETRFHISIVREQRRKTCFNVLLNSLLVLVLGAWFAC